MLRRRVLVTGMSGLIGGAVRRALETGYELTALNRRDVPDVRTFQADIAEMDAVRPAFDGQDVVVHLAAYLKGDWEGLQRTNVTGTLNVFEAARQAGAKRVVFISSGATMIGYEKEPPLSDIVTGHYERVPPKWPLITHEMPVRPNGLYGISKAAGEAIARYYSDYQGMSAVVLRFGRVRHEDRPVEIRDWAAWCSRRDAGEIIKRCVEAPDSLRWDVFYAQSDNKWAVRDMSHAREVLGFVPRDRAEDWRGR